MAAVIGPVASGSQEPSVGMAWKWILEKLLELPISRGTRFLNEVISHVHDIEEPQHRQLLERVAVRCLEEMVLSTRLDPAAIPLVKALTEQKSGTTLLEAQSSGTGLILRVETEAVLSFLRKASDDGKADWAGFSSALENIFTEEDDEPQRKKNRQELAAFLHLKDSKEEEIRLLLESYALGKLQSDLLCFLEQKKTSFQSTFLEQLSQDVVEGNLQAFMLVLGDIPTRTYEQFKEKCLWMAVDFADLRTECGIGGRMDTVEGICDGISVTEDVRSAKHTRDITGRNLEMTKLILVKREITPELDAQECGSSAGFVIVSDECAIQNEGEHREYEGPSGTAIKGQSKECKHEHAEREEEITMPGKMSEEVDSGTDRVPNGGHATPKIGVPFQDVVPMSQTGNATERPREKILSNVEVTSEDDKESGSRGRMETKNGTDGPKGAYNNYGQWEMHEGVVFQKQTGKAFERKGQRNVVILESDSDQHEGTRSRDNLPAESSTKRSEDAEKKLEQEQEELQGVLSARCVTRLKRQKNVLTNGDAGNIFSRKQQDSSSEIVAADGIDRRPAKVPKQRPKPGRPFVSSIAQKGDKFLKNFSNITNLSPSQPEIECLFNQFMPKVKSTKKFHTADNHKNTAALQLGEPSRHHEHQLSAAKHIEPYARTQVMEGFDSIDDYDHHCHKNKPGSSNEDECSDRAEERGNQWMRVKAEGAELEWLKSYLREGANHQTERLRKRRRNLSDESDELLELGSDGHEERCHKCKGFGNLLCCDGCPISMHSSCLQLLSLKIPQPDEEWYCPVCCEKKATNFANHAEQAVAEARAKLEAFRKVSLNKHHHSENGFSGQYASGRTSKHSKITAHRSAPVKNNNESEGRAIRIMRHSQDLLNILKARKDLLRQNLASTELALFARKPSKLDKWRALYNVVDSSSKGTLDQNNRQEDELEVGFREISAAAMDMSRNLDFLEYKFNPVFQALEEVCDVGEGGLMFEKSTTSNGREGANSGKEAGSSAGERRSRAEAQILSRAAMNCREQRRRQGPKLDAVHGDPTGDRKGGMQPGVATERRGLMQEGVQKYSHDDHSAYQWKEILKFGVGRFQPSRTTVDLKDKWRNLQKGVS